jgi:F-type H+-transporting ATPase subunit alpha
MDAKAQPDGRGVILRTPVALEPGLVRDIRKRLSHSLGRDVLVSQRIDRRLRGIVLVIDERHQVVLDLGVPLGELERQLAAGPAETGSLGERAEEARHVISTYQRREHFAVAETNLARAFEGVTSSRVLLRVKVELDDEIVRRLAEKLSAAAGRPIAVNVRVDPRLEAGAILFLGDDRRIVLDSRYAWLTALEREATERRESGLVPPENAYDYIRQAVEASEPELRVEAVREAGTVLEVGDGIAVAAGLSGVGSQELVEFEGGVFGIAFNLLADRVGCILLGPEEEIREGSGVVRTGHLLKVPVGDTLTGRIVNALGQPLDDKGPLAVGLFRPAERKAPSIVDRAPVDTPLQTGIKVIDTLVPLGRGQRELIIGDRKIGKSTIAIDTILNQRDTGVRCVYASIGQKASSVARVVRTFEEAGAMAYTTVVVSLSNEQCAFRYLTPYTACAIGEHVMDEGGNALVVFDDLSKHAVTYREMSALLKRPIGREAYPGDVFYVHSRLLERAARLSDEMGAGTLTALPIVETLAGDISAFIPTNVISISDGQIFLDTALFNEGVRPAMDVGLSVSRVGGAAQIKAVKQVAGRLRMDLAQYTEMAQFVKFGAEVDQATLDQLARGERGRELLKQDQHHTMPVTHQVAVIYAVTNGFVDDVPLEFVSAFEEALLADLERDHATLLQTIRESGELAPETEEALRGAIIRAKEAFGHSMAAQKGAGEMVPLVMTETTEAERAVV